MPALRMIRSLLKWTSLGALVVFLAIQLVPVERTNPPVTSPLSAPEPVQQILRKACYDCHSHETHWPWYSRVAPVSWWLVDHVEHGRGDLNFSEWPVLDFEAQEHALHDIVDEVGEGEMPLWNYKLLHPSARLTDAEREALLGWARGE